MQQGVATVWLVSRGLLFEQPGMQQGVEMVRLVSRGWLSVVSNPDFGVVQLRCSQPLLVYCRRENAFNPFEA